MAKKKPAKKRTKRTPKKRAEQKTTLPDWADAFLAALASTANIRAACLACGVGRTTVYQRRDAESDFAARMAAALDDAVDDLELEARRRAFEGCERAIYHKGEECGRIREYSDTLMIFLLKAHRPEKYREHMKVDHSGNLRLTLNAEDLSDDELAAIARSHASAGG